MSVVNVTVNETEEVVSVIANTTEEVVSVIANTTEQIVNVTIGGSGDVVIQRSDASEIATVSAPATYEVDDSVLNIRRSDNTLIVAESVLADSTESVNIADSDVTLTNTNDLQIDVVTVRADASTTYQVIDGRAQLRDSAGNFISNTDTPATEEVIVTAPDGTLQVNGGAFGSARSNQTVDLLIRNQNGEVVTPTSLAYPQINISNYDEVDLYMSRIGSTDATFFSSLRAFKAGLITDGLWTKARLINPVLGGSSATHQFNLIGAIPLDFFGTITHSSTGMTGNGTNGYYNTRISLNELDTNSHSAFLYLRSNVQADTLDFGCTDSSTVGITIAPRTVAGNFGTRSYTSALGNTANTDSRRFLGISRTNSANYIQRFGGNSTTITQASVTPVGAANLRLQFYGMAFSSGATAVPLNFSNREHSFIWIGEGLTSGEIVNLESRVNTLMTALGRNV